MASWRVPCRTFIRLSGRSLPLDRAGWLGRVVVDHAVDALHLVHDPRRAARQESGVEGVQNGDTVTLIKALPVKGAGFTAKQGTAVRKISLEPDNAEHISGRVEGQRIVILTKFVKKS